ncbi:MAG: hypothetical protein HY049_18415 [Acidobacteria bacterium]|nr:hypothetical protein [Acidobacteriota bacterium]
MFARRISALVLAVLVVAVVSVQPAHAGLGGCVFGCRPQAAHAPVVKGGSATAFIIDSLRWFLPSDVASSLKAAWSNRGDLSVNGHAKVQGLGGCFFGCKL